MNEQEATNWVFKEMEKLTPKHYIRTYFTLAELRPEDPRSDKVVYVVLPVDVYERESMGYEIMPVRILAENCPWDMERTLVRIDSENTHIIENLHDILIEDIDLHKHLVKLDESEKNCR